MRILVISNSEWDNSNSFGNTMTNLFNGTNLEFANIFCREGSPRTETCKYFLKISEKTILRKFQHAVKVENNNEQKSQSVNKCISFAKVHRWTIFLWLRELIWETKRWKCKELYDFLDEFNPDIILLMIYPYTYINKLAIHIKNKKHIPMLSYVSDDDYTLKQFSLSPLFWINRLIQRRWVKKSINASEILYVISKPQKEEYEKIFSVPCKILTKSYDFKSVPVYKTEYNTPLKLLYAGNIGSNRWKSLAMLAKALKEINKDIIEATLDIYTATVITKKMYRSLMIEGASNLYGCVSAERIKELQKEADILVYAEPIDLKNRLLARLSFSTKIVDYLKACKPILAIGPDNIASMEYLKDNNCAFVCKDLPEIKQKLQEIISNRDFMGEIALKAYMCGRANHEKSTMQNMLIDDLCACKEKYESSTN